MRTCKFFLVDRTSPRSLHAPIPSVLPRILTSSTSFMSRSSLIWGSRSSALVIFRPLPSREKTLVDAVMSYFVALGARDLKKVIVTAGGASSRKAAENSGRNAKEDCLRSQCWRGSGVNKPLKECFRWGFFAPPPARQAPCVRVRRRHLKSCLPS